ncbi:MAG: hypothetical protein V3T83_17970 [Acidobacteriota bacterium]
MPAGRIFQDIAQTVGNTKGRSQEEGEVLVRGSQFAVRSSETEPGTSASETYSLQPTALRRQEAGRGGFNQILYRFDRFQLIGRDAEAQGSG